MFDMKSKRDIWSYIIGSLASACAGILAFGIMHMAGKAGLGGWQWIFILEVGSLPFL